MITTTMITTTTIMITTITPLLLLLPSHHQHLVAILMMGISCVATQIEGQQPILWHSRLAGRPAPRMTVEDVAKFVTYLNGTSSNAHH